MPTFNLAAKVPPKLRAFLYTVLGVASVVEAYWDLVPAALEGKIIGTAAGLGFLVALGNVPKAS